MALTIQGQLANEKSSLYQHLSKSKKIEVSFVVPSCLLKKHEHGSTPESQYAKLLKEIFSIEIDSNDFTSEEISPQPEVHRFDVRLRGNVLGMFTSLVAYGIAPDIVQIYIGDRCVIYDSGLRRGWPQKLVEMLNFY